MLFSCFSFVDLKKIIHSKVSVYTGILRIFLNFTLQNSVEVSQGFQNSWLVSTTSLVIMYFWLQLRWHFGNQYHCLSILCVAQQLVGQLLGGSLAGQLEVVVLLAMQLVSPCDGKNHNLLHVLLKKQNYGANYLDQSLDEVLVRRQSFPKPFIKEKALSSKWKEKVIVRFTKDEKSGCWKQKDTSSEWGRYWASVGEVK